MSEEGGYKNVDEQLKRNTAWLERVQRGISSVLLWGEIETKLKQSVKHCKEE